MDRRDHQINGHTYSIILPSPMSAMPLCTRSVVLVGAFAGLLADLRTLGDTSTPKEARTAMVLEKFSSVLGQVDPIATNKLMMDAAFAAHLTYEGNQSISSEVTFDKHFEDKRSELFPVLVWCLWECVSDFFPQLGAFTQLMKAGAVEAFQSPTAGPTTTG